MNQPHLSHNPILENNYHSQDNYQKDHCGREKYFHSQRYYTHFLERKCKMRILLISVH